MQRNQWSVWSGMSGHYAAEYALKSYVKRKRIHFHYIDSIIFSGSTIHNAKSLISSIFTPGEDRVNIFSTVVVLVNRIATHRKDNFLIQLNQFDHSGAETMEKDENVSPIKAANWSNFRSFMELFVPDVGHLPHLSDNCLLCQKRDSFKEILDYLVLDDMQLFYQRKIETQKVTSEGDARFGGTKRHFQRLILSHNIFSGRINGNTNFKQNMKQIWEENRGNPGQQINFIKVLTSPLLSYYLTVKRFIFPILLIELESLLKKEELDDNKFIRATHFYDLNLLIVLMKALVDFKSKYIIRFKAIKKIWRFYFRFHEVYGPLLVLFGPKACQMNWYEIAQNEFVDNYNKLKSLAPKTDIHVENEFKNLKKEVEKTGANHIEPLMAVLKNQFNVTKDDEKSLLLKTLNNLINFKNHLCRPHQTLDFQSAGIDFSLGIHA